MLRRRVDDRSRRTADLQRIGAELLYWGLVAGPYVRDHDTFPADNGDAGAAADAGGFDALHLRGEGKEFGFAHFDLDEAGAGGGGAAGGGAGAGGAGAGGAGTGEERREGTLVEVIDVAFVEVNGVSFVETVELSFVEIVEVSFEEIVEVSFEEVVNVPLVEVVDVSFVKGINIPLVELLTDSSHW